MIKFIGPHRITCASVDSPEVDEMLRGVKVSVLYSDPPWGDGNARYWATMNKKMTGVELTPLTYEQILTRIDELVERYVDGRVMIDTGPRWVDQLVSRFEGKYYNVAKTEEVYKGGGKIYQCWLVSATTKPSLPAFHMEPFTKPGGDVSKDVLEWVVRTDHLPPGSVVLDPFCGMGYTAIACLRHGMTFYGNEFNAKRLQEAVSILDTNENLLKTERV